MTRVRGKIGVSAAVWTILTFLQPAATMAVQELIGSGVSSVVRDTPYFGNPTLLWTTTPDCSNAAGDETRPAIISRASLSVATPRVIFSFNPVRPVGTCNPYRLLSDVISDGTYLYYIDNQGPEGHAGLWRRPVLANAEDPSQFLADIAPVLTHAELLTFGPYLFTIAHGGFDVILEHDKNTGTLINGNVEIATANSLSNIQYDGRYLYWINGGALRRNDTTNGAKVTSLPGPIQTYYLEGYDMLCSPEGCEEYSRVLYGQDNGMFEIETLSGSIFPIYTSPVSGGRITNITRDGTRYYFIERRPVGGGFDRDDRFFRLSVGNTVPALIYGPINNGGPGFDSFTTDLEWIYFRDRVNQKLLRVENDAAAIPVHDLAASGIEVTQGLQNRANALRLIEGKRTIVRFYVKSAIPSENVAGVTAALSGSNQQGFLGTLEPVNAGGKLITVSAFPKRSSLDQSFQFELPRHWTEGGNLTLSATVNPYGRVIEDNGGNNTSVLGPIQFTRSPRLHVNYCNFWYYIDGTLYQTTDADLVASERRMRRLYPLGEPGASFDGPGLHFTVNNFVDFGLGAQVARTDQGCIDRYAKASDRNLCASDYVHGKLNAMRKVGSIRREAKSYGNIAEAVAPAGKSYFTRGYANGEVGSGPSTDVNYASHEVGHTIGRAHPSPGAMKCGQSASDDGYPYANSLIENSALDAETRYAGLDFADRLPGTMQFLNGASTYDTMAYCTPNWISDYTFNGMYSFLTPPPPGRAAGAPNQAEVAIPGDWLIATGTLDPASAEGGFVVVQRTNSVMDATAPVAGGYTLELRNGAGGVLASHPFTAPPIEDQPGRFAFDLVVRFVPGTAELRVVDDATGLTLATRTVSAAAPLVSDVLLPGAPNPVDGVVSVTWTASDPDGDALRFDVLASRDGGETYRAVLLGIESNRINLDTAMLAGGTNLLRVVASDGVQTAYAESPSFTVPPRPPVPVVVSPVDGFHADWGQLVSFEVEVNDLQDEFIPDARIVWANQYGSLGMGRRLQTDRLQVGTNEVTVTATNSLGAIGSGAVTVVIGDMLIPRGPSLSVAPQAIAWHVAADDTATQTATLSVENAGDGTLRFDATSDADWLLLDSEHGVAGATAPRTFTVIASAPALLPAGTTSTATLTFQSLADPNDTVVVPVELSRGNVFDHTGSEPPAVCPGDCNGDGAVTINEIISGVNIALGNAALSVCPAFDTNGDGQVTINELIAAVSAALSGC